MTLENPDTKIPPGFRLRYTLRGHLGAITQLAWSPDARILASSSRDRPVRLWDAEARSRVRQKPSERPGYRTIRLWDMETGNLLRTLEGHSSDVTGVAWSPDGQTLGSGSYDNTIRLWDIGTGKAHTTIKAGSTGVLCVAWSPDGQLLASGLENSTLRLWDTKKGKFCVTLKKHVSQVMCIAWSPDGKTLASGSRDGTLHFWNIPAVLATTEANSSYQTISKQTSGVLGLAWSPNGQMLATAHHDRSIRLWNPETAMQTNILEGHTGAVMCVSFSPDGQFLASRSTDGEVRLWCLDTFETVAVLDEPTEGLLHGGSLAFHPAAAILATLGEWDKVIRIWDLDLDFLLLSAPVIPVIHYVNAKVVLVGESGVGKSGLAIRIAEQQFRPTDSTHGTQFWQIPMSKLDAVELKDHTPLSEHGELTLWDLAGQPEYRLVHQLFLNDTDVALLLFDCSDPSEPFRGVPYWAKVLKKQVPSDALKFLISARCDVSPVTVSQREINRVLSQYELDGYMCTSAKTGEGVNELWQQLLDTIPWDKLPRTTTPLLFQIIREFLLERKQAGDTLVTMDEIRRRVYQRYTVRKHTQADIYTVVGLLQAQGLVHYLKPIPQRTLVLLRPELINQYASSIIQAARNHPRGIGAIPERDVLVANIPFTGFERLEEKEERLVLEATVELLIRHDLCFREMGLLVFPSQINVTRPTFIKEHPPAEVTYQFSGSIEAIYASLVVRLSYTNYFQREDQWRYAVEFSRGGHRLGFAMRQVEEGTGELEIYFHPGISEFDRVTFIRFVTDHLRTKGIDIEERIRLYCPQCGEEVENLAAIERRVQTGELDIPCQYCATMVLIPRSIEERYRSDRSYVEKQRELSTTIERRTAQEVQAFKTDRKQYTKAELDRGIHILHLSDIHLGTEREAGKYLTQLETDLRKELQINRLEYLIISGDVVSYSTPEEYKVAFDLVDGLVKRFGLDASRVVIVPGNHDLNWDLSADAYAYVPKHKLPDSLTDEYISASDVGALRRDVDLYKQRFAHFNAHFYRKVYTGQKYPLDYAEQGILHSRPDDQLLFLALNSCWEVDHHYRDRACINMDALSRALDQLQDSKYDDWLKIAVWHHPVTGREMMNDEFLQLLAVHSFQICMHGHVHEAIEGFHKYDEKRGLHIVGAGTFGAPTREQVPGIPLQYNLLVLDPETRTITVETRKKEKPDGAWSADARWGDKNDPKPRYTIQLKEWTFS